MNIHIIMHESFESPGALETWAKDHGHTTTYSRVYAQDSLPTDVGNIDMLVIMGGPQSSSTTLSECRYFDAVSEISLIRKCKEAGKLLWGACLGAQLIGEAFGAPYEHSPEREIGFFTVKLTAEGESDPLFAEFPSTFMVGHWHGDMPGVTKESKVLAESDGCPRQIVRYSPKAYGFQCHFEFTPGAIEGMIANSAQELNTYRDRKYVQQAEMLRSGDCGPMNELLFTFLDRFTK